MNLVGGKFLLVTSATGTNGDGYGKPLVFDANGKALGAFSDDSRVFDPRGLGFDRDNELVSLNSGADRVLALDRNGKVVRDTDPIPGLNPGGGNLGRMVVFTSGCGALDRSWLFQPGWKRSASMFSQPV